jgi:hypothetical protein
MRDAVVLKTDAKYLGDCKSKDAVRTVEDEEPEL